MLTLGAPRFLHRGLVTTVAYSPDGKLLASGGQDATLRLWEAAGGKPVRTIPFDQPNWPLFLAFSPDGKRLLASNGKVFGVWDVSTGKSLHRVADLAANLQNLVASPDGRTVATRAYKEPVLRLWDVATRKELRTLEADGEYDRPLLFSGDGTLLAVVRGYKVRIHEVATGKVVHDLDVNPTAPCLSGAALSRDGKTLAVGCMNHTVQLWDLATGKKLPPLTGLPGPAYTTCFGPDGRVLATSTGYRLQLWNLSTRKALLAADAGYPFAVSPDGTTLAIPWGHAVQLRRTADGTLLPAGGHAAPVNNIAYAPDGKTVATSDSNTVRLWDSASGKELQTMADPVASLAFSPDGKRLAGCGLDGGKFIWDVAAGGRKPTILPRDPMWGGVGTVAFAPDGRVLAGRTQRVELWDLTTGTPLITRPRERLLCLAYAPDGKVLAAGSAEATDLGPTAARASLRPRIRLWDPASGKLLRTIIPPVAPATFTFSPHGDSLACLGIDCNVRLWDLATGQDRARFPRQQVEPFLLSSFDSGNATLTFLADGRILTWTQYESLRGVWDVRTGRQLFHDSQGHWPTLSPDGKVLALTSIDPAERAVRLIDVTTGKTLGTIRRPTGYELALEFSPDGRFLALASGRKVHLWEVQTRDEVLRMTLPDPEAQVPREQVEIAFSPDGKLLAVGTAHEGLLWLRDTRTGKLVRTLRVHASTPFDAGMKLRFAPHGRTLLSDSVGALALWDVDTGKQILTRRSPAAVLFSPDGKHVVFQESGWSVRIHETATGKEVPIRRFSAPVTFAPDGKSLAVSTFTWGSRVVLWDLATATDVRALGDPRGGPPDDVALLPDSRIIAVSWEDWGHVNVWDVKAGRSLCRIRLESPQAEPPHMHTLALSPDGNTLADWDLANRTLTFWDVASGQVLRKLATPQSVDGKLSREFLALECSLVFTRDGRRLFGVCKRQTVTCWEVATGKELLRRRTGDRDPPPLGFSPDGRYLVEVAGKTIALRDVDTGKVAFTLDGVPAPWNYAVAFSPDGRRVAVGCGTATAIWDLNRP
jgi:WD40 repeat protein